MSSVFQPVGPNDPQVYWKRRAVVAGLVLLVIFLIWFFLFRSSGDEPQAESTPSPAASTSPVADPSASVEPTESPSASPTPTAGGACVDSDIDVTVVTDKQSYPAGVEPKITMSITNTSDVACKRDVGSKSNEIKITSGGQPVYSPDECNASEQADEVTLEPGQRANVTVQWNRTLSAGGCSGDQIASAGSYDVVGRNGTVESEDVVIALT